MKRLFSIAIAAMLVGQAWAQTTFTNGYFKYTVTDAENHYVSVNKSNAYPPDSLVIPETVVNGGVTYTIKSIEKEAFDFYTGIEYVSIPNTVETIEESAFGRLYRLKSVEIPLSVTSIGEDAFRDATHVFYSGPATGSPWGANYINCVLENGFIFKDDGTKNTVITYIGYDSVITVPSTVTSIADDAFAYCSRLKSVELNNVVSIGNYAFSNCDNLESITIPNSVKLIGNNAFLECHKLASVDIPESVTSICASVFVGCRSLTAVNVAAENVNFSSVDGVLFNKNKTTLICYPSCKEGKTYTIPNTVTTIENKSFYYCQNLDTLIILDNVTRIEGAAFEYNRSVKTVILPNSINKIESMVFYECSNLESITIPSTVTKIGNRAFYYCSKLKPTYIPQTVTSIDYDAFKNVNLIIYNGTANGSPWGAKAVINGEMDDDGFVYADEEHTQLIAYVGDKKTIAVPASVTTIGDGAFGYCSGLKSVKIPNTVTSISNTAFQGCNQLDTLSIYTNSIGTEYSSITSLKSVYIGATVTNFATDAFSACTNLEEVKIDANTIGTAFSQKTSLKNVIIGNTVESIESGAFAGCTNLKTVEIPSSVTTIGDDAFLNVKNIVNNSQAAGSPWGALNVGGVEDDGGFIFSDSQKTNLVGYVGAGGDITIPGTVVSISEKSFYNCGSLTSVTIPSTVTSIALDAFSGCGSLTAINVASDNANFSAANGVLFNKDKSSLIRCMEAKSGAYVVPSSVTRIADSAFYNCKKITSITLADNLTTIGRGAFAGCTKLAFSKQGNASYLAKSGNGYFVLVAANSTDITECTINSNCKVIAEDAFQNCSSLSEITIPTSVTSINKNAFKGCSSLTIKCKAVSQPAGWDNQWNPDNRPVEWTKQWTVTVEANNSAYGNVSGGGVVIGGSTADITATPKTGYKFVKWSNGLTNASATITVTSDTTLTAEFEIIKYNVTVAANNTAYGNVSGGGSIAHGSTTSITATPATGYKFVKWSNGSTSATQTITVTSDLTLTAEFVKESTIPVDLENQEIPENPIAETPADSTSFRFSVISSDNHKVEVSGYTGTSGNVVIPHKTTIDDVEYTVTAVGDQSFRNNNTIVAVTIPNTVTNIKSNAFRNCRNLEYVVIPSSVTTIGEGPFCERNSLTAIYVAKENKNFVSVDGVVYSADMKRLVQYPCAKPYTVFEIPNTVERIEYGAFSSCPNLESLIFPNSLENIRWWAISGCGNMKSFVIPKSVTTIGGNAIRNCKNLTIYCEAESEPSGWDSWWNYDERPVVWGYTSDPGDFTFNITSPDNFTVDVTGYSGSNANVLIPRKVVIEGDEYTVTGIASGAFLNNNTLTNVTIPEGVTRIAYQAFRNCSKLTSVVIPNSVTTIGGYAFAGCSNLTSVTIPAGVTSISERAFMDCSKLASVKLSEGLTSLADVAFYHCTSLTSLDLPSTVTSIGASSFEGCTGLTSIVIPEGTTSIGYKAFYNCAGLTSVKIPNTVTTIGYDAFWNCKDATIYCNLESKPEGWNSDWNRDGGTVVWNNKKWIVTLSANNSAYGTVEGGGTVENGTKVTIKATPATGYEFVQWSNGLTNATETITVTSDVTLTAEFAEESTIPENPNDETAADSTNFRFDILSSTDHTAEVSGYYGTSGNVVIPHKTTIEGVEYTVTAVGDQAFRDNYTIVSVTIPNTVTNIKSNAFRCCKNLESVAIPSSVTTIGEGPFCESNSLTAIYVDEDNANFVSIDGVVYSTDMKRLVQYPCAKSDTAFVVPNGVERIEYGSFSSCPNLKSLVLSNTVKTIRWWAICGCGKMDSIVIPISVTSIESDGIRYCKNLTIYCEAESEPSGWSSWWNYDERPVVWGYASDPGDFTFDITSRDNFTVEVTGYIGSNANVVIPGKVIIEGEEYTVTAVGDQAFRDNNTIVSVTIPNTVTNIKSNAFRCCRNLESVVIPSSVTTIGEGPFCERNSLTAIYVDKDNANFVSVDGVVYSADMKRLVQYPCAKSDTVFVVPNGVERIEYGAFSSCPNLKSLVLPNTVKTIRWWAICGCGKMDSIVIPNSVTSIEGDGIRYCKNLTIYCEAESEPTGWSSAWNYDDRPVVWGYSSGNHNNNEETPDSDFTFKIIDNNSAEVTGYTGTETAITIPQKVEIDGNEYTVTSIGNKAFEGNDKLTAVVIPNTVTTIGDNAFSGCTELDSIVIPNSVENISSTAFVASEGTCGLTAQWRYDILTKTLTISGEGWLDGYGYDFNTHTDIKAPWAVYNDQMESVVVEEGITGLGSSMFSSSNVKYVSLPSTCNSFSSAFNMCRQLEKVIIRTRFVMSVNSSSFDNYDNCTLYVPMDLVDSYSKEIVFRDFSKVVGFYIITVDSEIKNGTVEVDKDLILENESFSITPTPDEGYVVGNVLVNDNPVENTNSVHAVGNDRSVILVSATFNKAGNGGNNEGVKPEDFTYGIISFSKMQVEIDGYNGTSTDIEIPKTVNFGGDEYSIVAIGDEAFKDCSILKSVTIPSTIKSVGDDAFSNCSSLESVTLPNTIEAIGACTFAECSSLKSIEIPNSVTFIGNSAFAESGLTSVVIPNSVTEISSYAFQDCADLVSVEIPNSVESIGMSAFQNCSSLASVKIPSSVTNIGMSAFKGCRNASFECEAASKPDGWDESWNYDNRPVVWKNNAGTAVAESAANAVNIYAYGNTIVVENADAEIFVYDAMGRLVVEEPHFDASTEIRINGTGVYLVKVGNTTKRVMIND